jgi:hypothetical protein
LGVPFHYLKGTSGELEKLQRIEKGNPGSPCTEKHLVSNTEFTKEPICTASAKYQKLKMAQLQSLEMEEHEYQKQLKNVLEKECLCIGLSNAAATKYEVPFLKNLKAVTICPGPNIAYFSRVVSLQTMTDHIYGRANIIAGTDRPHLFIAELSLYISYLKKHLEEDAGAIQNPKVKKYYNGFCQNLINGIAYYRGLQQSIGLGEQNFNESLCGAENEINNIHAQYALAEYLIA